MMKWEVFEEYLFERDLLSEAFKCETVAADLGISTREASMLIQAYLDAQRSPTSRTLFVLSRNGRTSAAVWHVGARSADVRGLARQVLDDMAIKVYDALEPDMRRMAYLNPRCAKLVNATTESFLANLKLLEIGLEGA